MHNSANEMCVCVFVCVWGGGGAERYYNIERFKRSREEQRLKTERDRQTERLSVSSFLLLTNCM